MVAPPPLALMAHQPTTNGNPDNGQDNNGMYDMDHDGGHEHTEGSVAMRDEDGNGLAAAVTTTTTKTARQTMTPRSIL